ncbi:penicillin-binding protein 2 [Frankia sp. Cppng1_Ct_nod]|uniref:peptidoglycan D,D-transpeptidase FtsI family protein n=1 Tax=Frankia sp. Cppng1_Ct_nod TaxID=2897162 RepID=UPI0020255793|nr:penicillin-binding protein 2 [Frankia sp. Cppng1_Ct_nod]
MSDRGRHVTDDQWVERDDDGFAAGYADPDGYGYGYGDPDGYVTGEGEEEYAYRSDRRRDPRRARRPSHATGYRAGTPRGPGPARRPPRARVSRPPMRLGSTRRRLRATVVILCALLVVLAGRLTQLQGFQASAYAKRAEKQRTNIVTLDAARGVIADRSGATLAQDVDARSVYGDPSNVTDARAVATALSPLLKVPVDTLVTKLLGSGRFVYLARGLEPAVGKEVAGLRLSGIGVLEERRRMYPSGSLASNVVGFTTVGDNGVLVGGGGIEGAYDRLLRGTDGVRRVEVDPAGRPIPSGSSREKDPVPGSGVRLTLDRDVQWAAQNAIAEAVRTTQADGGTVVVMEPATGNILAMADAPDYDPNRIGAANPATLKNRATQDVYEPGSVNKVITMAAAIDRGLISADTPVTVPSNLRIAGQTFTDAEPHATEYLTATGVLARSSNIGTILIARKLGSANLEGALRAFGLGSRTALRFPGESAGLLTPSSAWDPQQAATIAYGQGMSATAIQMASVYATIANGGVRVPPRLVDSTTSPDGIVHTTPREPGTRVISESTAATLSQMLEAVTSDSGTAPLAAIPGYRVAGKTGTAERVGPAGHYNGYVASFVGFAPADQPKVVVEVVLDNPRDGHFGGTVAAPVFKKVMSFALATMAVPPTGTTGPKLTIDLGASR